MKKVFIVAPLVLALLLSSCSKNDLSGLFKKQYTKSILNSDAYTEPSDTSAVAVLSYDPDKYLHPEIKIKETVIYDKDNVRITAKDIIRTDKGPDLCAVAFWLENNYSQDLTFFADSFYVNGLEYRYIQDSVTVPGNSADVYFVIYSTAYLEAFGITEAQTFDISFTVTNSYNATYADTDLISFKSNYFGETAVPFLKDSIIIAENEDVIVSIKILDEPEYNLLEVFATNKSDRDMRIMTPTLNFGEINLDSAIRFTVPAGKSIDTAYDLNNPMIIESAGDTFPTGVEISFGYRFDAKNELDWISEPVQVEINCTQKAIRDSLAGDHLDDGEDDEEF
ncbi:MAG: hypothetical protein K6F83_05565 [Clostridiales bacterium]|nr:hypothetical protein [Clostridiales bacterium]